MTSLKERGKDGCDPKLLSWKGVVFTSSLWSPTDVSVILTSLEIHDRESGTTGVKL